MITAAKLKQPPVFKLAFFTAMCERFGFYVLSFMLVLYAKAEFGLSDTAAFSLFAVVTALAFMMPAIGGYVADNFFGIRRSIILGLFLEGLGLCLLGIPNHFIFPFALASIVIGVGFFKTAPTNLMGRSYEEKDPRIDGGFTLFYMGMNIGSFSAALICGLIQRYYGWHIAFLVGGIGILLGLIFYFIFRHSAENLDSAVGEAKLPIKVWASVIGAIVLSSFLCAFLLSHVLINNILFFVVGVVIALYYIYEIIKTSYQDKMRIIACLVLILIGMVFFALYFQAFTSMELFINRIVNRNVLGFVIPTEAYIGLNAIWVIILSPILAATYKAIVKSFGKDLTVTMKFGIGLVVVSLCFFSLVVSTFFTNGNAQVNSLWIVLAFGLFTLGEMLISALGVAMVTHLVPKHMYGVTMGTWFFGSSLAALTSGLFASLADVPKGITDLHAMLPIYNSAFTKIGLIGLGVAVLVFIISPYINRMANLD